MHNLQTCTKPLIIWGFLIRQFLFARIFEANKHIFTEKLVFPGEEESLAELELPRLELALTTHQMTVSSATLTLGLR